MYAGATLAGILYFRTAITGVRNNLGMLLLLGLTIGWCNIAFVLAILDGNVVRVLLLFYLSPLWAVILAWIFLKERPDKIGMLVIAFAMIGAVVMLWDPEVGFPWPKDSIDLLALSSGFAFACSNVVVRYLQGVPLATKVTASWVGCVMLALLGVLLLEPNIPAAPGSMWIWAILLGVFGMSSMTLLTQFGITHLPIYRSSVILLFELVAGAISAQLLTNETVLLQEWIGGLLIIGAAIVSGRREMKGKQGDH